jgi:type IV secretion system protein VirB10
MTPGLDAVPPGTVVDAPVAGERGVPSVNPPRAVDARIGNALAIALVAGLGVAALGYYYTQVAARPAQTKQAAESAARATAGGESTVPPLGRVDPPRAMPVSLDEATAADAEIDPGDEPSDEFWGEAPLEPPLQTPPLGGSYVRSVDDPGPSPAPVTVAAETPADRRLRGPAFATRSDGGGAVPSTTFTAGPAGSSELGQRLQPTVLASAQAKLVPNRRLLLPKGAFLDCTLETAIESSLPGLVTCVTATDTFGADGRVVLLERGTRLIGETRGDTRAGSARLFVLWNEARTPTGVVVELAAPGTDELGRSGVAGEVDRHFGERFGAAILLSVIDGAIQAGVQAMNDGGDSVVVNSTGASDVMTEILKETVSIPPTIRVAHGTRLQVLVARDLDFRSVYELDVVDPAR